MPTTPVIDVRRPLEAHAVVRLSTVDRFLPVWIGLAMLTGLWLGRLIPGLNDVLDAVKVGQTFLPIALGLLLMMYPVLAKSATTRYAGSPPTVA